jgi:hypothetical protein
MPSLYRPFLFVIVFLLINLHAISQSNPCSSFSGVAITDTLEQDLKEYIISEGNSIYLKPKTPLSGISSYQWKKDGVDINGATNRKYQVTEYGLYSLTVRQGSCTATSLGIFIGGNTYYQIDPPAATQVCVGDTIVLKTVKGLGYFFQWKKDGNPIQGATKSEYKAFATGNYTVVVSQGRSEFKMETLPVYLTFGNTLETQIVSDKNMICEGKTTVLKASNINNQHRVQWLHNGTPIDGATKDSLVVNQSGYYEVQITKGACSAHSGYNVSVTNLNLPRPIINDDLGGRTFEACSNNVVKLRVKDYRDGTYIWLKEGNVIPNATSPDYTVRESGNYSVRYNGNEFCSAQSEVIPVYISSTLTMDITGNDLLIAPSQLAIFTANGSGVLPFLMQVSSVDNGELFFQNYFNTLELIIFGGGGEITTFRPNNAFRITKLVNACGVGTGTGTATVTIGNCAQPTVVNISTYSDRVCLGGSTVITALATGSGNLSYQWQKDGVDIAGETQKDLLIQDFSYAKMGRYRVKVSSDCGTFVSTALMIVANYGNVVVARLGYPAYTNTELLLTAFSGTNFEAFNSYTWTGPNGFTSTEQNPIISRVTPQNSGVYTVLGRNASGCYNSTFLNVTVNNPPITIGNLGLTSFCPNGYFSVPFSTTLPVGTPYKVYLSDQEGNFQNATEIGSGLASPISVRIPFFVSVGTEYRLKIVAQNSSLTSTLSSRLSTNGKELDLIVYNSAGKEAKLNKNLAICKGAAITLNMVSNQKDDVIYQWKKREQFIARDTKVRLSQEGTYTASVQKMGCSNVEKTFTLTSVDSSSYVLERLGNEFQCEGTNIIFKPTYYSDSATYQWRRNGSVLLGAIADTLVASQTGKYSVDIRDKCPLRYQSTDAESVVFGQELKNGIISNRAQGNVLCGEAYTYLSSVDQDIANPLAPYSYQWQKNGVPVQGDDEGVYYRESPNLIGIKKAGVYSLKLSQGNCSTYSNGINITRVDTIKLALKLDEGSLDKICTGMTTTFTSDSYLSGNAKLYKDGVVVPTGFVVSQTGSYVLTDTYEGCVILPSDTVKISVGNLIKPQVKGLLIDGCVSAFPTLYANINANSEYSFQWFKDGTPISNSNSTNYNVLATGSYQLKVSKGACSGMSEPIPILQPSRLSKPKLKSQQNLDSINYYCSNTIADLSIVDDAAYTNYGIQTFILKRNGQTVLERTGFYDNINQHIPIKTAGTYTVVRKQGPCEVESDPVIIKFGEPITAKISGGSAIYQGQSSKLNLSFGGGNAWVYQLSNDATLQNTTKITLEKWVKPRTTQIYTVAFVGSNCGVGASSGSATVTVLPCPTDKTISVQSGNWNVPATWSCGQIPTATLKAIIEYGHTVNLPNGYQGVAKGLVLSGGLNHGVNASLKLD